MSILQDPPLIEVRNLSVHFATPEGDTQAVRDVSFAVHAGETVAIVGESGSGKSQSMMAAMGLLPGNARVTGEIAFKGRNLLTLPRRALRELRGAELAMIFQEPMTSLDPLYRIGDQLIEPIRRHSRLSAHDARARALEMLGLVRLPEPERMMRSYPHELSGGQRQRVMIAMALTNDPALLIADEPTTALDVTIQAEILALMADLQKRLGMGMVFISHDLNMVRHIADRVCVMRAGEVVEHGPVAQIFEAPQHPYTRALIDADPKGHKPPAPTNAPVLLHARDVTVTFGTAPHQVQAVRGLSLDLRAGETVGIVGESGSGKSTFARALLRLNQSEGEIRFDGVPISTLTRAQMRPYRAQMQVVFQDPFGALSPRMTAGQIVTEGLLVHRPDLTRAARDAMAAQALTEVQLNPEFRNRYIHEFSGGQRQRIAIARALILKPRLLVLDEPTSALDRMVQAQVVDLLRDLQARHQLTYLFISHDLAVVRAMADRVMVMKSGELVEEGPCAQVLHAPRAAYTKRLIAAAFDTQAMAPA
ncbi:MAG: ABC transporter ATP-binding protein [Paracoccaceae bacterium]|nr:ABC transporter ATP-binding protein [Paracoccaceae bacterium]